MSKISKMPLWVSRTRNTREEEILLENVYLDDD